MSALQRQGEAEPAGEGWLVLFSRTSVTWLIFCPTTSRDVSNGTSCSWLVHPGLSQVQSLTAVPPLP